MHTTAAPLDRGRFFLAIAGPAAMGASFGVSQGLATGLTLALALPAILIGVVMLTTPALYVGSAFVGFSKGPREVLVAVTNSLSKTGIVLLGVAPTVLLLSVTTTHPIMGLLFGGAALVFSGAVGLYLLYSTLFDPKSPLKATFAFCVWGLAAMGIAARVLIHTLEAL